MCGCESLRSDCTSRSCMHSSHEPTFRFIRLIATISPVARCAALNTAPYLPVPTAVRAL